MASDFFERQRRARGQSLWLRVAFGFGLGISSLFVALGVVLLLTCIGLAGVFAPGPSGVVPGAFFHGRAGWWIAAAVLGFSLCVSAKTAWRMRDVGGALARELRARPVAGDTADPGERRLLNVVGEMAIASGVPEPAVWLLDREESINAFAAGREVGSAAIGVTAGALEHLDRDELQAVVAHEFSHVLNGDMALNTRMVAWLAGLFAIENLARALRNRERGSQRRLSLFFWSWHLGFWLLHACGYAGLFIGRALQAAICRRREALADASAVQFTRNAAALRSALVKIEAVDGTRPLGARGVAGMAHLFFAPVDSGVGGALARLRQALLETHPPMAERVRALDPGMSDAQYRAAVRIARKAYLGARERAAAPVETGGEALRSRAAPIRTLVPDLACSRLTGAQQDAVLELRTRFGATPQDVQAVFVAALLDPAPSRARAQLLRLAPVIGAPVATRVPAAANALARLAPIARYPLLEGLVAAAVVLPDAARLALVRVARAFESRIAPLDALRFATVRLLLRSLLQPPATAAGPAPPAQPGALPPLETHAAPAALLCSLLARCSTGDDAALEAYRAGLDGLLPPRSRPPFSALPIDAGAVDDAIRRIAGLPHAQRSSIGAALVRVIAANGTLSAQEFDLLRAICGGLAIPVPNTGTLRRERATEAREHAGAFGR